MAVINGKRINLKSMSASEVFDFWKLNKRSHRNFYSITREDYLKMEEYQSKWNKIDGDEWYVIENFIKDF